MWRYQNTNDLYHHGILGMKWGVRRYQNADGSLTPAGRKRANKLAKQYADITGKKLIVKKKAVIPNSQKSVKEMSDAEIQQKINRHNLENTYNKILASESQKNKQRSIAKRFINSLAKDVIGPASRDAGRKVLSNLLKQMGNEAVNDYMRSQRQSKKKKK